LQAGEVGHLDVEEEQVNLFFGQQLAGSHGVVGDPGHFQLGHLGDVGQQQLGGGLLVINNQGLQCTHFGQILVKNKVGFVFKLYF
jgi:hypothetical protein